MEGGEHDAIPVARVVVARLRAVRVGAALLGDWEAGSSDVTFGRDGKPFYINGPRDDTYGIMAKLRQTVGGTARLIATGAANAYEIESPLQNNRFAYAPAIAIGAMLATLRL